MLDIARHPEGGGESFLAAFVRHPGWMRWGAHFAFWLMYFGLRTAAAAADPPDDMSKFPFLANRALMVATYIVGTGIVLMLAAGVLADRSSRWRNLGLIGGSFLLVPLAMYAEEFWPRVLMGPEAVAAEAAAAGEDWQASPSLAVYFFNFGWVLPLWGFTQALLGYHFQTIAQQRAISRAQSLAYDAQLRMLHYQINPHFLFNTLNAISTLVLDKRTDQAESMLMRLSGFLRYSLDRHPSELAQLSAELEAQRKYLEIEQTRFGDKLQVRFEVEPGLECVTLPSLILQPILENAIKYAVTPSPDGGCINVSAFRDGDLLRVRVDDDGPGIDHEAPRRRRGVGLANARERLTLIYGERAGLSTQNRDPHGCRVEIWLPLEERKVARTAAASVG